MTIVVYARCSTSRQQKSGLGLEAQRYAVTEFASRQGARILAEFVEAESGRKNDRPELLKAISYAKMAKATLVVAKLDRLARNVAFLSALMERGLQFICLDCPEVNPLVLHILAAVAEHEAKLISQRTSAALQAAKRRGRLLGAARQGWAEKHGEARQRGATAGGKGAAVVNKRTADDAYSHLYQKLSELQLSGQSFRQIAKSLNEEGQQTRRGRSWTHRQVAAVIHRGMTLTSRNNFEQEMG